MTLSLSCLVTLEKKKGGNKATAGNNKNVLFRQKNNPQFFFSLAGICKGGRKLMA